MEITIMLVALLYFGIVFHLGSKIHVIFTQGGANPADMHQVSTFLVGLTAIITFLIIVVCVIALLL